MLKQFVPTNWLKILTIVNTILILGIIIGIIQDKPKQPTQPTPQINNVSYKCDDSKTIQATFFEDRVELELSDKRSLMLMQGMSASGIRYINTDESITFWSKGNTAFMQEGKKDTITFANCVQN